MTSPLAAAQPLTFVGIDVAKSELVIAYKEQGQLKKCKIANTLEAIDKWLAELGCAHKHFILEYTGVYSHRLVHGLSQKGALFSVANPTQSRAMAKVLGKTHKNDEQDAQTLAVLGQKLELPAYKMPAQGQKERKEAFAALSALQKQERQLKNQLHAFEYHVNPNPAAVNALKEVLRVVQQEIKALQKVIAPPNESDNTPKNTDNNPIPPPNEQKNDPQPSQQELLKLISSIKCIGENTAKACLSLFGDFSQFHSAKAFVKFIGLSPSEFSSGESVKGRKSITKKGNSDIRNLLFNCARTAFRFNPICKNLYQRLIKNGKNGKVALVAVMHKLARLIFGVIRSNKPFDVNFVENKLFVIPETT